MGKGHKQAIHKRNRNGQYTHENMLDLTSNKMKRMPFFNILDKQRLKRLLMSIVVNSMGKMSLSVLMMMI